MKEVKMRIRNEDGKYVSKTVPESLVSNYLLIGWEIVKDEKVIKNEPLAKDNKAND